MKKLLLIILITLTLFFPSVVFSAMTWTITADIEKGRIWGQSTTFWQNVFRVKLACVSDGSDPDSINLSDYLTTDDFSKISGGVLYQIETDPGVAPDAVWDVTFSSDLGSEIMALTGLSVTVTEPHSGSTDLGFNPVIFDLKIDFADIGSNLDSVDVYFYIIK